jgi:transposase
VKDAEWIADLVRHGLVRPSFVPPLEIRELRDLVRHRRTLAETLASERNRTLKLLETANIKLSSVATDVFGVSGTAMLRALAEGDMAPEAMAELAKGRLRTKLEPLVKALQGRVSEHHRFLLRLHPAPARRDRARSGRAGDADCRTDEAVSSAGRASEAHSRR